MKKKQKHARKKQLLLSATLKEEAINSRMKEIFSMPDVLTDDILRNLYSNFSPFLNYLENALKLLKGISLKK